MKENRPEIIVGLDIGTTKVCAIICEKSVVGKIHVLGIGHSNLEGALKRGEIVNIEKTAQAIKYALNKATKKTDPKVEVRSVYVGIAGQHIRSIHSSTQITRNNGENEIIGQADIDYLMKDIYQLPIKAGEQILHVFPEDFSVDDMHEVKDPKGIAGVRLEGRFHIIAGNQTAIEKIKACVISSGIREVTGLVLEPVASSEAVLSDEEKDVGVAIVDIGGGTTDLAIFHEGVLRHTSVIPLGGNIITRDIKIGCNVQEWQAETMKTKFGSANAEEVKENEIICIQGVKGRDAREISIKNLAYIIQARVEEIFEFVDFEIKKSGYKNKLSLGIVLTGGGAQLKNIDQLASYVTGLDAKIGLPNEYLSKGMIDEVNHPMYSTCIGLILYGLKSKVPTTNSKKRTKTRKKAGSKDSGNFLGPLFENVKENVKGFFEDDQIEDYKD